MLKKLQLASGRIVSVTSLLLEETGAHVNAVEPFPQIAGRFQMAASGVRTAAARVNPGVPLVLVDAWARWFDPSRVHAHPITMLDQWNDFQAPAQHPPRWTCCAWLISTPIAERAMASELVIGWFVDAIEDLDAQIIKAASTVDWEQHARDWEF